MDLTQLHRLASRLGLHMSTAEALVMLSELRPLQHSTNKLDKHSAQCFQQHDHNSNCNHRVRSWWRPSPDSNQHNALLVRCSITAFKSDPNQNAPTSGKRVAVKNTIAVAGPPLSAGSRLLSGFVPPDDAPEVARLLEAGVTLLGKTNCEALGASSSSHTSDYGPVLNPAPEPRALRSLSRFQTQESTYANGYTQPLI